MSSPFPFGNRIRAHRVPTVAVALGLALALAAPTRLVAQEKPVYTHADSLRGSLTSPARTWWDVTFYDLDVAISPSDSTIAGHNSITYRVVGPATEMQIDLQKPLVVDSIVQDQRALRYRRDGNAFFAIPASPQPLGSTHTVTIYYHGEPKIALRPPWDGGFTWTADSLGRPWVVTTDEGVGASIWWPNKDVTADEPDSARVAITVPDPMIQVGNGRLRGVVHNGDGTSTYTWVVANPINNYSIAVAAGSYGHFSDTMEGELGTLTLDYWPLSYHMDAAKRQFAQVKPMIRCFEHWFGPYPWYRDGYKLVEVPNTGMEHQSAVAYGNHYANGYRGGDRSGTGLGLDWDFIIIHESAHEWFGNSITMRDQADMWIHEAFASYAESLYTECQQGKAAGARYAIGSRRTILNDVPIIPAYGVNAQGSGDMYAKGESMLHMIRQIVNDDDLWRSILRGLNQTFWHQSVSSRQIEDYISSRAGIDLSKVFDQYLRTTMIPTLEYRIDGATLSYRWTDVVPGFDMQVGVTLPGTGYTILHPTEQWQTRDVTATDTSAVEIDPDYYVRARPVH